LQVLEEYIITTSNNNGSIGSKMWHEQGIKYSRLYLVRNEEEDDWGRPMSNRYLHVARIPTISLRSCFFKVVLNNETFGFGILCI